MKKWNWREGQRPHRRSGAGQYRSWRRGQRSTQEDQWCVCVCDDDLTPSSTASGGDWNGIVLCLQVCAEWIGAIVQSISEETWKPLCCCSFLFLLLLLVRLLFLPLLWSQLCRTRSSLHASSITVVKNCRCSESWLSKCNLYDWQWKSRYCCDNSSCFILHSAAFTELPGFYFDPEKNRYFRLLPGHNNCNPLTKEKLKEKEREKERQKMLAEDEKARKVSFLWDQLTWLYYTYNKMSVGSYGRAIMKVIFYLEIAKNRTELLLGPTEKTPRPVTVTLLLQVEVTFFMN